MTVIGITPSSDTAAIAVVVAIAGGWPTVVQNGSHGAGSTSVAMQYSSTG
jgi:hypothetical protein